MPVITDFTMFNGFETRTDRLGLSELVDEVRSVVSGFVLRVEEERNVNGTQQIRRAIDDGFQVAERWTKSVTGDVDWVASLDTGASVGVEVQVSGRSDMVAVDVLHLRRAFRRGLIDAGIMIVPDDELSKYLTDRAPSLREAQRHIKDNYFDDQPIALLAFRHDGPGPRLTKQRTRQGRGESS